MLISRIGSRVHVVTEAIRVNVLSRDFYTISVNTVLRTVKLTVWLKLSELFRADLGAIVMHSDWTHAWAVLKVDCWFRFRFFTRFRFAFVCFCRFVIVFFFAFIVLDLVPSVLSPKVTPKWPILCQLCVKPWLERMSQYNGNAGQWITTGHTNFFLQSHHGIKLFS